MAELATGNREDALELVQEAMIGLVSRYATRDQMDWPPLFHRILQSRIRDWYRRTRVRNRLLGWLQPGGGEPDSERHDPIQEALDPRTPDTLQSVLEDDAMASPMTGNCWPWAKNWS